MNQFIRIFSTNFITVIVSLMLLLSTTTTIQCNSNFVVKAFQPLPLVPTKPLSIKTASIFTNVEMMPPQQQQQEVSVQDDMSSGFSVPMSILAGTVIGMTTLLSVFQPPAAAFAADITKGEVLFQANCAGCHANGKNYVSEKRTLSKEDIMQYRKSIDQDTITNFVQNGMPHKLLPMKTPMDDAAYNDVVAYVLDQANNEKW